MNKSIRETSVKSPFLGKEVTEEDLQARYAEHLLTNPKLPTISTNEDGSATIVTSYFEDAEPKVSNFRHFRVDIVTETVVRSSPSC